MSDVTDKQNQAEDLKREFRDLTEDFRKEIEKRDDEFRRLGTVSQSTREEVSKIEGKLDEFATRHDAIVDTIDRLVAKTKRPKVSSREQRSAAAVTLGTAWAASAEYARLSKRSKENLGSESVHVGSLIGQAEAEFRVADLEGITSRAHKRIIEEVMETRDLTSDDSSLGVLTEPLRLQTIVAPLVRSEHIRDLMNVSPISTDSLEWVEEAGFRNLSANVDQAIAGGEDEFHVSNVTGFYPGQPVTLREGNTVEKRTVAPNGVARDATGDGGTVTVTAAFSSAFTVAARATSPYFGATPETRLKPEGDISFIRRVEGLKTIARGIAATRQILADAPRARSFVDNRLTEGFLTNEDRHLLYGAGTSDELQGMMTNPGTQSYQQSAGASGDTRYDAIRRAMILIRKTERRATGCVLNPVDIMELELMKSSDNQYLNILQGGQVWRMPFVETTAIEEGDFLVADFVSAVELFDREQISIRVSEHHRDLFMRNMIMVLMEAREGVAYYRPDAIVAGEFDGSPA